jgi:hypothetical protein
MILYIVSAVCSVAALYLWSMLCRPWLQKRSQTYLQQDLADHMAPELPMLISLVLPRPLRRIYHFLLVNIITAFIGVWHFFQLANRGKYPDFWEGYFITLGAFMLLLIVPAFFWERERLRRKLLSADRAGTAS